MGSIVLATTAAYWPAIRSGGFVWDDDSYLTNNPVVRSGDGLRQMWVEPRSIPQYYPLTHTTFWIEYHLWGLTPRGYHAVNVGLHAISAVVLWVILRQLRVPGAWVAAAVFALHPVHVESVAWITERKNVLSGLFYLLGLYAYGRCAGLFSAGHARTSLVRWSWYALASMLFLAALLSKTITCSLPAVLALLLWWRRDRLSWRDIAPLVPWFAAGVGMGLVTAWIERSHVGAEGHLWALTPADRVRIAGYAVWFYAAKLVWPANLTFIYPRWSVNEWGLIQFAYPAAVAVLLAMLWVFRRRIGKGPLVAVLIFTGTLVPALGFFNVYPMRYSFVADHFQYLASIGLIVLLCASATRALRRSTRPVLVMARVAAGGLLLALAVLTWRQTHAYQSAESLWLDTLEKNPGAAIAHNNLGKLEVVRGNVKTAIRYFRRAIATEPNYPETYHNLGIALGNQGHVDEAIDEIERALKIDPYYTQAHNTLGLMLARRGRIDEAITHFEAVVRAEPNSPNGHYSLANVLLRRGRADEAVEQFREVLRLDPLDGDARRNLALALDQAGRVDEAVAAYGDVLKHIPDDARAHLDYAELLDRLGRVDEAAAHEAEAARLRKR